LHTHTPHTLSLDYHHIPPHTTHTHTATHTHAAFHLPHSHHTCLPHSWDCLPLWWHAHTILGSLPLDTHCCHLPHHVGPMPQIVHCVCTYICTMHLLVSSLVHLFAVDASARLAVETFAHAAHRVALHAALPSLFYAFGRCRARTRRVATPRCPALRLLICGVVTRPARHDRISLRWLRCAFWRLRATVLPYTVF